MESTDPWPTRAKRIRESGESGQHEFGSRLAYVLSRHADS
jgi:hypothetical protein